jgi:hypothetical protein
MFCYELQEEAAELEEILAKRQKRGKQVDDKPLEEKTVLHSKDNITFICKIIRATKICSPAHLSCVDFMSEQAKIQSSHLY